jgi:hypothetical protein
MNYPLIDAAMSDISDGKDTNAQFASLIQSQDHDHIGNRILLTAVQLQNERKEAKQRNEEVTYKPEYLFTFVEQLMNKVCWNARRYIQSVNQAAANEMANGIDFSEDIAEQINIEPTDLQGVETEVADAHEMLNKVQVVLGQHMSYIDREGELAMFTQREPNEVGKWTTTVSCDNFAEAQVAMNDFITKLEEQKAVAATEVGNIDFDSTDNEEAA